MYIYRVYVISGDREICELTCCGYLNIFGTKHNPAGRAAQGLQLRRGEYQYMQVFIVILIKNEQLLKARGTLDDKFL